MSLTIHNGIPKIYRWNDDEGIVVFLFKNSEIAGGGLQKKNILTFKPLLISDMAHNIK